MSNKEKEFTTSYKYFTNDNIVLVTSAKVGSRFLKSVSNNLQFQNYGYPFNNKLEEVELDSMRFQTRSEFVEHAYKNLFKNKDVVFFVRNPQSRFISGLTTMFGIIHQRAVNLKHDGKEFMKSYFEHNISEIELQSNIDNFLNLFVKYLNTKDVDCLNVLIEKYVLNYAIYKDSHVERHHYYAYLYMNQLRDLGAKITYIDINSFDEYLKTKELIDWGYEQEMNKFKHSEKNNIFYQVFKDNIEIWKSEIKELSLYFDSENEYYDKIKAEYEILL